MSTNYNATAELTAKFTDDLAHQIIDDLGDFHPVASRSTHGRLEVVFTVEAGYLRAATSIALGLLRGSNWTARAIEVLPTDDFDRRLGLQAVPELVSTGEAATLLGISRQAVLKRINAGTLPARPVGGDYAIPRAAIAVSVPTVHAEPVAG